MEDNDPIRKLPDVDIIALILNGNVNAFKFLVERYQDNVASVVTGMLGSIPEAEDIGQEIFIRTFKSLKKFRFRSAFKTYLVRIAMNACLDEIKNRQKKKAFVPIDEGFENRVKEDREQDFEIRDSLARAIRELNTDQRSVVILGMMDGYSTKETAAILRIPEGTVLSRLARAQEKLRELLQHLLE